VILPSALNIGFIEHSRIPQGQDTQTDYARRCKQRQCKDLAEIAGLITFLYQPACQQDKPDLRGEQVPHSDTGSAVHGHEPPVWVIGARIHNPKASKSKTTAVFADIGV
jgi:hypothetical protein